ncbi:uncharacterized protein LOC125648058 isoform X1 [Ostrea edulis]|uniref:uncharacterized protein LOC125648058 isoform X1 n=1 Tax=Ostrea edulis TaxID=37623 RepID=UPI0024AEA1F1|nr:uncharacterized protein LOC125648058 isoform X1 [Ostrea edulis]
MKLSVSVLLLIFSLQNPTEGLQCLRCSDTFEPRLCNRIEVCNKGEVCGVRLYRTGNGDTGFWTGCMSSLDCGKTINRTVIHPKRDGSSSISGQILCTECCVGGLCNSQGCGAVGYPSPRGPICYDCRDIHSPADCHKVVPCSANEKCLLEERTVFGQRYFTSRCEHGQTCDSLTNFPSAFGRRRSLGDKCHQCCHGDLCNDNCNLVVTGTPSTTVTTSSVTTSTPPPSHNIAFFTQNTNSVSGDGDLTFNETVINVGNGYTSASGMFTCSQAGLYMFAWNIASHGYGAQTNLLKNGYPVGVAAITDPRSSSVDDSSTSFAVLRLNTNDKVNVHRYASGRTSSSFFAGWRIDNHHRDADAFTVALNRSSYTSSQIPFNSVIFDNNGSYISNNYSFISTSPGLYVFGVTGEQTGGYYDDLQLQINGALKLKTFPDSESGHSDSGAILGIFRLNSGDTFQVGGSHYVGYKGTTTFSGYKILDSTQPAFTATLTSDTSSSVIIFDDELLDTHGDYDRLSGVFTCSVPGTYIFTWSVETNGAEMTTQLVIQIKGSSRIDGPKIVGEEIKRDEYDSSTGVFIYILNPGDTAKVQIANGKVEGRRYSSFSGWLLF